MQGTHGGMTSQGGQNLNHQQHNVRMQNTLVATNKYARKPKLPDYKTDSPNSDKQSKSRKRVNIAKPAVNDVDFAKTGPNKKNRGPKPMKITTTMETAIGSELPTPTPEKQGAPARSPSYEPNSRGQSMSNTPPRSQVYVSVDSRQRPITPPKIQEMSTPNTEASTWDPSRSMSSTPNEIFSLLTNHENPLEAAQMSVPHLTDDISSQAFFSDNTFSAPVDTGFELFSPTLSLSNFSTSNISQGHNIPHGTPIQPGFPDSIHFNPFNLNSEALGYGVANAAMTANMTNVDPFYYDYQNDYINHGVAAVAAEGMANQFHTNLSQVFLPLDDLSPRYDGGMSNTFSHASSLRCGAEDLTLMDSSNMGISVNPITLIATTPTHQTNIMQQKAMNAGMIQSHQSISMSNLTGVPNGTMVMGDQQPDASGSSTMPRKRGPGGGGKKKTGTKGVKNGGVGGTKKAPGKHRPNFPQEVVNELTEWFMKNMGNPYPAQNVKEAFAGRTSLSLKQVNDWFINARRRKMGLKPAELPSQTSQIGQT
ncbi:hypothetical protein HDU67_005460 [Dinochytrium kinnereticum]|nr:hypothetical protein HDU67_005460 [Dinochytrium kinnereticum]